MTNNPIDTTMPTAGASQRPAWIGPQLLRFRADQASSGLKVTLDTADGMS
jgi:hypothetical protein